MDDGSQCVLVVDDDEDLREMMATLLRDVGYSVRTAEDGAEALAHMRENRPCVVLLDLMMPNVDGWQVMQEMARDPELAHVPVCIISAQAKSAPAHAASVLPKPVTRDVLLRTIRSLCRDPCAQAT